MRNQIEDFVETQAKDMLKKYRAGVPMEDIALAHDINNEQNVYYYLNKYCGGVTDKDRKAREEGKKQRKIVMEDFNES